MKKFKQKLTQLKPLLHFIWDTIKSGKVPTWKQFKEFSKFTIATIKSDLVLAPDEVAEERWKICQACPFLVQTPSIPVDSNLLKQIDNIKNLLKTPAPDIISKVRAQLHLQQLEGKAEYQRRENSRGIIYNCGHCGCDMKKKVHYAEAPCGDKENPRWYPMSYKKDQE